MYCHAVSLFSLLMFAATFTLLPFSIYNHPSPPWHKSLNSFSFCSLISSSSLVTLIFFPPPHLFPIILSFFLPFFFFPIPSIRSKSQTGGNAVSNSSSGKFNHSSDTMVDHVALSLSSLYVSVSTSFLFILSPPPTFLTLFLTLISLFFPSFV